MAYIGNKPTVGNFQICDAISVVNGQAAYTMQVGSVNVSPQSANHMIVSLNGTIQKPNSSFTVSGSTITFSSNLVTGDVIDFIQILGDVLDLGVPSDATVTTNKLASTSVTAAKLNNDIISGTTALASEPADTDEFLVSDAGTLKRIDYSLIKSSPLFTKITATDISAGGSVTIQNCFNSTYRNYFITFERIKCATDGANLLFDPIDTNGNQTDEHGYQGLFMGKSQFSNNWSADNGATYILQENLGNASGEHFSGFMYAFNPNQASSSQFSITWQAHTNHNGAAGRMGVAWGGGRTATNTSAYTGFNLLMSAGNINSGTVSIYGINDPT